MFRRQDSSRERTADERARAAAERAARRSGRPLPPEAFLHETPPPPLTEAGRASSGAGEESPPNGDAAQATTPPSPESRPSPPPEQPPTEERPAAANGWAATPALPTGRDAAAVPAQPDERPAPPDAEQGATEHAGEQRVASAAESRADDTASPPAPASAPGRPVSDVESAPVSAPESPADAIPPEPASDEPPADDPVAQTVAAGTAAEPSAPQSASEPAAGEPAAAKMAAEPTAPESAAPEIAGEPTSPQPAPEPDASEPGDAPPAPEPAAVQPAVGRPAASPATPSDAPADLPAEPDAASPEARDERQTAPDETLVMPATAAAAARAPDEPESTAAPIVNQPTVAFTPPDAIDHGEYRPEPAPAPQSWIDGHPQDEATGHMYNDDDPPDSRPPLPRRRTEPVPPRRRGRRAPPRARMPGQPAMPARGQAVKRRRAPRRILALLAMAAIGAALYFINATFQPFHDDGTGNVAVSVPAGADAGQIGEILADAGVVDSGQFFMLNATLTGRRGKLKPGDYTLRRGMSNGAAVEALQQGPKAKVVKTFTITLPEGRTRRELKPVVDDSPVKGNYVKASQSRKTLRRARSLGLPRGISNADGFLFPATYELLQGATAQDLVDRQLKTFADNRDRIDLRNARRLQLTPYDVVIIASMVEREASLDRERPLVAAVIHNRLRQGIPLGIDATIRYVENNWTEPLRQSELERDTPYNTRLNQGLPPTPIANPGLKSLQAAAKPADSDVLYYVVKPGTCGEHVFSSDYDKFLADQARYNEAREAAGGRSPTDC